MAFNEQKPEITAKKRKEKKRKKWHSVKMN